MAKLSASKVGRREGRQASFKPFLAGSFRLSVAKSEIRSRIRGILDFDEVK